MKGYAYHYQKAKNEFANWYYSKHEDQDLASFWYTNCSHIDDMIVYDDELKIALEGFDYCEQVKIIWHDTICQHVLKIKWEHSPYWANQVLHFYYCVLLPIDEVSLVTPASLVRGEEE